MNILPKIGSTMEDEFIKALVGEGLNGQLLDILREYLPPSRTSQADSSVNSEDQTEELGYNLC